MRIFIAFIATIAIWQLSPVSHINNQSQVSTQPVAVTETAPQKEDPKPTPVVETVQVQETPTTHEELLIAVNIPESQWYAVDYILSKESTDWCPTRWQGYHGSCPDTYYLDYEGAETDPVKGYGICQSTPAIKMESAGSDWRTNILTQLKWCNDYAIQRYGNWDVAYNYWINHGNW